MTKQASAVAHSELVDGGQTALHGHAGVTAPPWMTAVLGAWGDGDPNRLLSLMLHNPVNATPTNISVSVARVAYFRPPANITINRIRFLGVGATTNVYRVAIYRDSDSVRLTSELVFTTAANTWGSISVSLSLLADVLYFIAVAVNATGTTAGVHCHSGTTGRILVLPTTWPGNLDIDMASPKIAPFAFAQFAVTSGALPDPAPARVAQGTWTGGMPAFILDNNSA